LSEKKKEKTEMLTPGVQVPILNEDATIELDASGFWTIRRFDKENAVVSEAFYKVEGAERVCKGVQLHPVDPKSVN
jgi:hypothetical protein